MAETFLKAVIAHYKSFLLLFQSCFH